MKYLNILFAGLILFCGQTANAFPTPSTSAHHFLGHIDELKVSSFIARLDRAGNVEHILITSPGGSERQAIRLARYLNDRQISITAIGECSSACFQIVYLSNIEPEIVNNTVVTVHQSSYGIRQIIDFSRFRDVPWWEEYNDEIDDLAFDTAQLFSSRPTVLQKLTEWTSAVVPICLRRQGRSGRPVIVYRNRNVQLSLAEIYAVTDTARAIHNQDQLNSPHQIDRTSAITQCSS